MDDKRKAEVEQLLAEIEAVLSEIRDGSGDLEATARRGWELVERAKAVLNANRQKP